MKFDLVIFDLDGTLIDTIEDLGNAVNYALKCNGFPLHRKEEYPSMVGHGVRNLVTRALPEEQRSDSIINACLSDFFPYYLSHISDCSRVYPGIAALVDDLIASRVTVAVASNKFDEGTQKLIRQFFPDIRYIIGNREGIPLKPDPAVVEYIKALCHSKAPSDRIAFVGDAHSDIATARNASVKAVAVTWGFRPESELLDADFIAHNSEELHRILL